MKDFDTEREQRVSRSVEERSFRIGGETFVLRDGVRPEVLAGLDDLRDPVLDQKTCTCGHPRQAHGPNGERCSSAKCECVSFTPFVVDAGASLHDRLASLDDTFLAMIEHDDDAVARYRNIREREFDPIMFSDLGAVVEWMVEQQTRRRPTGSPSASTRGRSTTGTSSTESSSSPDIQAA